MSNPIEVRGVTKEYPYAGSAVQALRGIDLTVGSGDWVTIMGPSGCGKSTLLNLIAGLDRPTTGSVQLLGRPMNEMEEKERSLLRLHHIGFVFQRFHLLSVLTAMENVELPMAEAGVGRRERRVRAGELLSFVGLEHRLRHRPPQLSGGEQQRVAIARALANRPELLLADEPTGELDQATGQEILDLLTRLNHSGTTLVTVTHDAAVAARATMTIRLRDGRVEEIAS
ncbi:ABC transporter ATP-binding protein [soil metagenome]